MIVMQITHLAIIQFIFLLYIWSLNKNKLMYLQFMYNKLLNPNLKRTTFYVVKHINLSTAFKIS